ncbi:hypothetical protein, partial [Porphyromonas crevioricanis]|uniref:hypothetical protein n=1 Tax=Porphyromonas crevioricanis TaxID=393921 RepID=UPI001F43A6BC
LREFSLTQERAKFFSGENFDPLRMSYSSMFWETNLKCLKGRCVYPYREVFFPPFFPIPVPSGIYKTYHFGRGKKELLDFISIIRLLFAGLMRRTAMRI